MVSPRDARDTRVTPVPASSVARWIEQAAEPEVDREIRSIYAEVELAVAQERPICLASGHCCRFGEFGHDLFVTAIEAAWFMRNRAPSPPDEGVRESRLPVLRMDSGGSRSCPYLEDRLCGARTARPLGCRTFHCDPRAARWSGSLHETLHQRLRLLHDRIGIQYHYDEWLRMLTLFGVERGAAARQP